jgi:hypothetical protein
MADTLPGVHWQLDAHRRGFALCFLSEEDLEETARRSNIQTLLQRHFQQTNPSWYGLWIDSPLSLAQCGVLQSFYAAVGESGDSRWDIAVPLRSAVSEGIPLHVEASPPGHADLGYLTTFVHCPRCKCEGPFPRWQESYPADIQFCGCCGQAYSPASTYSLVWEYSLNSFECTQCGQVVKGNTLTEEQLQILEAHDLHEQEIQEFDWLERIAAFYRRYPEAAVYFESRGPVIGKGKRVTFGSDVRFSSDALLNAAGQERWMSENAAVMEYLARHFFSLEPRRRSIIQSLNAWRMEQDPSVRCMDCGGELRRCSSSR